MAKKKAGKKKASSKASKKRSSSRGPAELIISKSRTKAAASINVSGDFYTALDAAVRTLIAEAETRAMNNGRRTLRPHDL